MRSGQARLYGAEQAATARKNANPAIPQSLSTQWKRPCRWQKSQGFLSFPIGLAMLYSGVPLRWAQSFLAAGGLGADDFLLLARSNERRRGARPIDEVL